VRTVEGVADMVEFEAQVSGHEATEKANRIQAWQDLLDWQLADRFDRDRPVLLLPGSWWSAQHEPEFESAGWWQKPTRRAWCKQCARCGIIKEYGKDFHKMQRGRGEGTSRAERTTQVVVEARQHLNGSERGSRFMLGSQRSHYHNRTNSGFVDSSEGVGDSSVTLAQW